MKRWILLLAATMALLAMAGCGGSGGSSSSGAQGVAVDPYISGAIFYEDRNNNGAWDVGEQLSTSSDSSGTFTFANPLSPGSTITMYNDSNAMHNGVAFTGKLKRKVDESGVLVVSPVTTLLANGLTSQQIIDLLTEAGLSGVTAADLTADPMASLDNLDASGVTEAQLKKIKATMMIYSFMAIVQGISQNGYDLKYADFTVERKAHLRKMVGLLNQALDPTVFVAINSTIRNVPVVGASLPLVTAGDVVRGAVAISNAIIRRTLASGPLYDYAPSAAQIAIWTTSIGPKFYFLRNMNNYLISTAMSTGALSSYLGVSYTTFRSYTTFYIDDSGNVVGR